MKVALVGAHGSEFDASILADSVNLIPGIRHAKFDPIDLRVGRDFLAEDLEYDVVILFYIFEATEEERQRDPMYKLTKHDPTFKTSPLHSKDKWRQRLLATKAQEILVFGCYPTSEVTGEYIGELSDYKQDVVSDPRGSVWRYQHERVRA